MYELHRDLGDRNAVQGTYSASHSSRRSSIVEPADPANKFKLTPYIKAFKSRLEAEPDQSQGRDRAASEVGERGPVDKNFVAKISKWEQKVTQPKQLEVPRQPPPK